MADPAQTPNQQRKRHLMRAGTAAAAAWALRRRRGLALPLAALAAREARQSWAARPEEEPAPPGAAAPEQVYNAVVDGIPMRWEEHGPPGGPPVVLVHGIPTSPRLWRYVIPRLTAAGLRCLAWEMVGFGWSLDAGLERDISVARQAEYLRAWLRQVGVDRALLVGHDLGGGVVQRLLVEAPERATGLVLTDCIAYDNWPVPPVWGAQLGAGALERTPAALLKPVFLAGLGRAAHDNAPRGRESARLHWKPYATANGRRALAHQLRSLHSGDTLEIAHELPRLSLPARVVWAEIDPLGMASGEQLARDLDAPLTRIPGGRHFTPEDHPDLIAEAVLEVHRQSEAAAAEPQ